MRLRNRLVACGTLATYHFKTGESHLRIANMGAALGTSARNGLLRICKMIAAGLLSLWVLTIVLDVVLRYVFHAGGGGHLDEASGLLFSWLISAALPLAVEQRHTSTLFRARYLRKTSTALEVTIVLAVGLIVARAAMDQFGPEHELFILEISSGWSIVFLPFGALAAAAVIAWAPPINSRS